MVLFIDRVTVLCPVWLRLEDRMDSMMGREVGCIGYVLSWYVRDMLGVIVVMGYPCI